LAGEVGCKEAAAAEVLRQRSQRVGARQDLSSRPLCAWPVVARYWGTGDTESATSFSCSAP
jgi:hypothetical protein